MRSIFAYARCARRIRIFFLTAAAFATLSTTLSTSVLAATPAGSVEGFTRDALAHPLSGTKLRLETPDGQVAARTTSVEDGRFTFHNVADGVYSVIGEHEGFDPATAVISVVHAAVARKDLTFTAHEALEFDVIAKHLNEARNNIQPRLGASTYTITQQAIENQPGGENNPLNQVILQAPGVTQDSFGQLHVRNEHANIQYRINGVALPEGVTLFGQSLSPRFASSADLITGALPAQYGLRTSGIIDIETKSGAFTPGGSVGMFGGSHDWIQPSAEYGGSADGYNYFFSADHLQNGIGIEAPTRKYDPIHDDTRQQHGFAYVEKILDQTSRVSAMFGTFQGDFEIPNSPDQPTAFTVNGLSNFDSTQVAERQRELNHYAIFSYLKSQENFDFQVSDFTRYSSLTFRPDPLSDVAFTGIAQDAYRRDVANGVQAESTYRLAVNHTLRSGLIVSGERTTSDTTSLVLPAGGPDTPFSISDNGARTGWTYSLYLQDEWRAFPDFTVNYGGRFDLVDQFTHESQFSPRLNLVWQAASGTVLHAGYARYFTPPPFESISIASISKFVGTTGETPTLENSRVKAERAHLIDIGVTHEVLDGLKLGVDAYYKYSRNLLDEGQFGAPIILEPFNYHMGRNVGVEFTGSYETGPLSMYGNLAIAQQKAKQITSAQFNFEQDELDFINSNAVHTDHDQLLVGSGGVAYKWGDTRFSADALAGSGLRAGFANTDSLPGWLQVNLGVAQRFDQSLAGPLEIRFDVINLFDKVYEIRDGSGIGVGQSQFGPRRALFAALRREF